MEMSLLEECVEARLASVREMFKKCTEPWWESHLPIEDLIRIPK